MAIHVEPPSGTSITDERWSPQPWLALPAESLSGGTEVRDKLGDLPRRQPTFSGEYAAGTGQPVLHHQFLHAAQGQRAALQLGLAEHIFEAVTRRCTGTVNSHRDELTRQYGGGAPLMVASSLGCSVDAVGWAMRHEPPGRRRSVDTDVCNHGGAFESVQEVNHDVLRRLGCM